MKRKFQVVIVSFLAFLLLVELFSFFIFVKKFYTTLIDTKQYLLFTSWFNLKNLKLVEDDYPFRSVIVKSSQKKPIVLLGCSFTYGSFLPLEHTLGAYLSDLTGRTVYNKGMSSLGPNSALYIVSKPNFKAEINDAEYFIYTYIVDHNRRIHAHIPNIIYNRFSAKYDIKENKLHFTKLSRIQMFIRSFYTYRIFQNFIAGKKKNELALLELIISNLALKIKENYPKSKFILIYYEDAVSKTRDIRNKEKIQEICKKNNIEFFYTYDIKHGEDIFNGKYVVEDKIHPSKEAWELLVPELVKKYNL